MGPSTMFHCPLPSGGFCRPAAFAPRLGELLEDHVALQPRQMVDEQDAFEMVHLVLEADRQQAVESSRGACPCSSSQRARIGRDASLRHIGRGPTGSPRYRDFLVAMGEDLGVDEDARLLTGSPPSSSGSADRSPAAALARRPGSRRGRCRARRTSSRTCRRSARAISSSTVSTGVEIWRSTGRESRGWEEWPWGRFRRVLFPARRFKQPGGARAAPGPACPRRDSPARRRPAGRGRAG